MLNEIMPEGFQHNVQSLRVVDVLELEGDGLNLTQEVRDGILCHTGSVKAKTLEGQILWFADRIAYINHDIEDAMRAVLSTPPTFPCTYSRSWATPDGPAHQHPGCRCDRTQCRPRPHPAERGDRRVHERPAGLFVPVGLPQSYGQGGGGKVQEMIRSLFAYYQRHPDDLPSDFQDIRARDGVDWVVCDDIAGMTDSYAVEKSQELFIPRAWTVKRYQRRKRCGREEHCGNSTDVFR
ncbi:MAG: hypothetical protein V8T16_01785 [Parabacteroides merdae]